MKSDKPIEEQTTAFYDWVAPFLKGVRVGRVQLSSRKKTPFEIDLVTRSGIFEVIFCGKSQKGILKNRKFCQRLVFQYLYTLPGLRCDADFERRFGNAVSDFGGFVDRPDVMKEAERIDQEIAASSTDAVKKQLKRETAQSVLTDAFQFCVSGYGIPHEEVAELMRKIPDWILIENVLKS